MPLGVPERGEDVAPVSRVVHEEHGGDGRPAEEVEGSQAFGARCGVVHPFGIL